MALRAGGVARSGEADRPAMIRVAGNAGWSEHLRRVMNRPVVAGQTFLVGDLLAEKSRLRDVAGGALLGQHGVCGGQASRRVHAAVAPQSVPGKPHNRKRRESRRKQEAPVAQRMRPFEIIQVDALREFFSCACSRHEKFVLVSQRHQSVNGAEQN